MTKVKIVLPLIIAIVITILFYSFFYNDAGLTGGVKIKYDKDEIIQKAKLLLDDLNVSTNGLQANAKLETNKNLLRQVQEQYGFKNGNNLLSNHLPGYFWKISWNRQDNSTVEMSSDSDNRKVDKSSNIIVEYDNAGNLLQLSVIVPDSVGYRSLKINQAREAVNKFISRFGKIPNFIAGSEGDTSKPYNYSYISGANEKYDFEIERKIDLPRRTDYQYTWRGKSAYINDNIKMGITLSGNIISNFKLSYEVPQKYSTESSHEYQSIISIIFYFIIVILIGYTGYKKIKAYEIGFKLAFFMAAMAAIGLGLYLYTNLEAETTFTFIISIILGPLFVGGAAFILWAISEAITRETWKEKFISLDLLFKGHLFHSKVGKSVYDGLTAGFLISVVWLLILLFARSVTSIWCTSYDSLLFSYLNCSNPAICLISKSIFGSIFLLALFFNFIFSGIRRRINSAVLLVIVSGVIYGLVNSNEIQPLYIGILLQILIGILFVYVYYKFDVFTSLVSIISFEVISGGMAIYATGNFSYITYSYFIAALTLAVILWASYSLFTKDKALDLESITPTFVRNITERERLQRELEIAKEVQMSFLPRQDPHFYGLEIASKCLPALEVGGDYYDFVSIAEKKIGIIVGDVSGKGTQAAFYMTLTKGFLKALSKISYSPKNFLTELNTLFYENVERGTFISMVYGIFDIENKTFKLSRAGHNPVIVKNSFQGKAETLNSSGLALGLEKGNVFANTIEEIEVPTAREDVFVFYTDGFTEAMNKAGEEFGEERLIASVAKNSRLPAQQILQNIFQEVEAHIGKASQHDDMTLVVVKVL